MSRAASPRAPRRIAVAGLLLLLAACGGARPWTLKDISGLMQPLQFTLTDEAGDTVHAQDYRGEAAVLYFGYTHCPDVCPATLAKLAQALRELGEDAARVRVLFVSVDPARDTPARLARYTDAFGPRFVGLTGTQEQLRALTKRYRVTYGYGEPDEDGSYEVSHSSAVFIFGPQGEARLLATADDGAEAIGSDLQRLVDEGG